MRLISWLPPLVLGGIGVASAALWPTHRGPQPPGCDTSGVPDACNTGAATIHHFTTWGLIGIGVGLLVSVVVMAARRRT